MSQDKIGKFIAKCRKEKNMTQQELALKLDVTDRAISNWENGRRLPDYSIIEKLCKELDITINELFACEKISNKDYKEKSDENVVNILKSSELYDKKKQRIHLLDFYISIIVLSFLLLYSFYKNIKELEYTFIIALFILIINEFAISKLSGVKQIMDNEKQVKGRIIKARKMWWIKIKTKPFRTTSLDGAIFPSSLQVKYTVNGNEYVGMKIVCWDDRFTQEGQEVFVSYYEERPQKVLSLRKK